MSRVEYDLVVAERPELKLLNWNQLPVYWKNHIQGISREELIASRTGRLLARDVGVFDDYSMHHSNDF